jgi:hypothetical protein
MQAFAARAHRSNADPISSCIAELSTELEATMNSTTVRVVSIVLAAGFTISKFVGIGLLAQHVWFSGDSVVVLPRITVTATRLQEAQHLGVTGTPSVIASTAQPPTAQVHAANQMRKWEVGSSRTAAFETMRP